MADYHDDLRFAHVLADAADAATMDRFKALDPKVETKPDMTPVSEADRAAEEVIRGHLKRARPQDAILGESTAWRHGPAPLGDRPSTARRTTSRGARVGHADAR